MQQKVVTYWDFYEWMTSVDTFISRLLPGFSSDDLDDFCYRDAFDDGWSAKATANRIVKITLASSIF